MIIIGKKYMVMSYFDNTNQEQTKNWEKFLLSASSRSYDTTDGGLYPSWDPSTAGTVK